MSNKGIGSAKPRKGGNNDSVKLEEVIQMLHFKDHADEWVRLRLLERGLLAVKRHWCKIIAGKEKKEISVPRFCLTFNPNDESTPVADVECPYCSADTGDRDTSPVTSEFFYLMNAIVRDIQDDEPSRKAELTSKEKKTGFKDIKSKSWTPVRVVRLTNTVVARVQELGETNIVKPKKTGDKKKDKAAVAKPFDLSHPKYGVDINVKFKPKAAGSDKYSVDKADDGRCALTEEEKEYLVWDLSEGLLDLCGRMGPKQALEDFNRMELNGGEDIDDDEDDDDDIPLGKKKKKGDKAKSKKKGKSAFDEDEDEDDDDEPKSKKKKSKDKSSSSKKKKSSKSDDDDDDDEDDDEDDAPKSKKKKSKLKDKASSKKKKSKSKSDDDDDEDDDEDEKPSKKKKSSKDKKSSSKDVKKKKKPSRDDDDDEDEDDEPKSKKKKKDKSSDKKKGKKSSKKSKIDDDDDEW